MEELVFLKEMKHFGTLISMLSIISIKLLHLLKNFLLHPHLAELE